MSVKLLRQLHLAMILLLSSYATGQPLPEGGPNGYARFSVLGDDLFYIAIMLPGPTSNVQNIYGIPYKQIEMRVLAEHLSARRLISILIEGAALNNDAESIDRNLSRIMALMDGLRGDLVFGDRLILQQRGDKVFLYVNSILVSEVRSRYVFNMILSYWIGPVPPSRDVKNRLLGLDNAIELAEAFHSVYYSSQRMHEVVRWFGSPELIELRHQLSDELGLPRLPGNIPPPETTIVSFLENPRKTTRKQ